MADGVLTREQQIIDHALKLFSQGGYRETSLQNVADELGLTRPAFYYYFKSKDDLLWRLIGSLTEELWENAKPIAASSARPAVKMRQLVAAHVEFTLANSDAFRIYLAERQKMGPARGRRLRRGEKAYVDLVSRLIEDGQEAGEFKSGHPRIFALMVLNFANSPLRWFNPKGSVGVDGFAELVSGMAVDSLARGRAARSR